MDLEFAKKRLLKVHWENEALARHNRNKKELAKEFLKDNEAIDTVIAELYAIQNLLDEKREKLDRLQKENELLSKTNADLSFLIYELQQKLDDSTSKDKIREKIKKHRRDLYSNVERYVADELEGLLKEE